MINGFGGIIISLINSEIYKILFNFNGVHRKGDPGIIGLKRSK